MSTHIPKVQLANGYAIPAIGFGTWRTPEGDVCVEAVTQALQAGYRHLDTACAYGNEHSVGVAIKQSGVPRGDLFVTSKLAPADRGYQSTLDAFHATLERLQLDYLDLYLIHWPASPAKLDNWEQINLDTWQACTELYNAGLIKAIGVSNFWPHHLKALLETPVKPMVNQIENHPGVYHRDVIQCCRDNNIVVEAYSPLGSGKVLEAPLLQDIARAHGKSTAQVCIRWCLQNNLVPLPKSVTPQRIIHNLDVLDFTLTPEEMTSIDDLPFCGGSNNHPDRI